MLFHHFIYLSVQGIKHEFLKKYGNCHHVIWYSYLISSIFSLYSYFPIYLKMNFPSEGCVNQNLNKIHILHITFCHLCLQSLNLDKFLGAMNFLRILIRYFSFKFMLFYWIISFPFVIIFLIFVLSYVTVLPQSYGDPCLFVHISELGNKNIAWDSAHMAGSCQLTGFIWGCLSVRSLLVWPQVTQYSNKAP